MIGYSKLLPYTCYEVGHTWHPSCTKSSFDMFISTAIASFQIYGFVYVLTVISSRRKWSTKYALQVIKQYLQSCLFLSFNGSFFVASFCVLRRLFCHINFISVAWGPGFIASYLAILAERQSRRSLLAIYVSNVASECAWNALKFRGYVKPVPHGEVLLFAASMALFGYFFKASPDSRSMIDSIFRFILGKDESGKDRGESPQNIPTNQVDISPIEEILRRYDKPRWKHRTCPHEGSCVKNTLKSAGSGMLMGYGIQVAFHILTQFPRLLKHPSLIRKIVTSNSSIQLALFMGWFSSVFKMTCCTSRWLSNGEKPIHGAFAGGLAALGMRFYSSPSIALYAFWKALEILYRKGKEVGWLPSVPQGVEVLYAFSTAYLFHMAVLENYNLKPSYWRFLMKLTAGRIATFNRFLLDGYGLNSSKTQVWPSYQTDALTDKFIEKFYKGNNFTP